MGYGGFFKSVVRIAVPAVVSMIPGMQPLGVALASAAATAATGGSFQESLMAAGTSYIGASVSRSLQGIQSNYGAAADLVDEGAFEAAVSGVSGSTSSLPPTVGAIPSNLAGVSTGGPTGFGFPAGYGMSATDQAIGGALTASDEFLQPLVSQFSLPNIDIGLGGITEAGETVFRHAGDVLDTLGNVVLQRPNVSNLIFDAAGATAPGITASAVGGLTTFTLNQALLANTPEADQLLSDQGYTPQQIQYLKLEARNRLSQQAFDELQETVVNPGLPEEEFSNILASGIERENLALGPDITEAQFRTVFDDPNLGQAILGEEESLRRQSFGQEIEQAFPGGVFQSLDDDIVSSIVEERQGPAQQQISRFGARGNLNPTGGQTANLFIQQQVPRARERVEEIGAGVLGGIRGDIGEIRGRAEEQAGGYQLGEGLFDVAPFSEERGGLIEEREGTLGADVRGAIGSEPLFDVSGALRAGGRAQGVVSGRGQNPALLDQIAARELGSLSSRNRRSLGSRGSGAF